jgi:NACalpha-BTF3-like transcription factor
VLGELPGSNPRTDDLFPSDRHRRHQLGAERCSDARRSRNERLADALTEGHHAQEPIMNADAPSDPKNLQVASDLDYEVKLLAERTGVSPEEARRLLEDAGSFDEAMRRLGDGPQLT